MRILFTIPSLESVYAARFIYEGLRNAFKDKGHDFRPFTSNDNLEKLLDSFQPDIFFYSLNFYHLKFIDLNILKKYRKKGLIVFCQLRSWNHLSDLPGSGDLSKNKKEVRAIKDGLAGDVFWHWFEQEEPMMKGFTEETGYKFETIHMAADKTIYYPKYNKKFECDISYVGSFLPAKRAFFKKNLLPLKNKYDVKIYGSDWTFVNKMLGYAQKAGQYFNINPLKKVRKFSLSFQDEKKVYSSAKICLNVHEAQVQKCNCEFNERTYKILACGGFELVDNVPLIRKYFSEKELVIAKNEKDWHDKIDYYLRHPVERKKIAKAGMERVLKYHTYHNRAEQIIEIYKKSKKIKNKVL